MATRMLECPSCGVMLELPVGSEGLMARCGRCKFRFQIPAPDPQSISDSDVLDWLTDDQEPTTIPQPAKAAGLQDVRSDTMVLEAASTQAIRLVRIGRKGALFEFPAGRLKDMAFRCSMPRRCLRCGSHGQLNAHVIIYAPRLTDSLSLEAAHSAGELVLKEEDVRRLSPEELLKRLPLIPNVPHPGDLPMPYCLCRMCGESGAVSGEIHVNTETGQGFCRLLIGNLEMAEQFFVNAGGAGTPEHTKLRQVIRAKAENPWNILPSTVRHRLEQWYVPRPGEKLIAYIPDRDRAQTEDGVDGLVISDRRLIWRQDRRAREIGAEEPLSVEFGAGTEGKGELKLFAPSIQIKHLAVDGEGIRLLRRALLTAKFKVTWR